MATGYTKGDPSKLDKAGGTMTGPLVLADGSPAASEGYVATHGGGGGGGGLPLLGVLFNVEDYGAVGDGATDDYAAIRAAWDAMAASPYGGCVFLPRQVVYRIVADVPGRLVQGAAKQYALFPIPQVASDDTHPKQRYGIVGVGEACVVRMWGGSVGTTTAANVTASVIQVDYSAPFTWSATKGLPSVFGARDMDIQGGYSFTNVHFDVEHVIVRQPPNPSMCSFNLEACSTARIKDLYCDVTGPLDNAPEPTHPTGAALLMPRTDNAVVARIDAVGAWGYYAGCPITEHGEVLFTSIIRCKIAMPIRRAGGHFAHIHSASVEQCPWIFAGYDPSGPGSNDGIVPAPTFLIKCDFLDVEDYDYGGTQPWMYVSNGPKAHVYDPNNALSGLVWYQRTDPGSAGGNVTAYYAVGGTKLTVYRLNDGGPATKLAGGAPAASSPPNAPTIGTATAGNASATVAFTPAAGPAATSYTATSTPGGLTGTSASSPITVNGLSNGTAYTFTVHATNAVGNSSESAASNSVTPTGATTYVQDTFNRADSATTLGTPQTGPAWSAIYGTWGISTNQADRADTAGGTATAFGYRMAVVDSAHADVTMQADVIINNANCELGLVARYQDPNNFLLVDLFFDSGANAIVIGLFKVIAGVSIAIISPVSLAVQAPQTLTVKLVATGNVHTVFVNGVQRGTVTATTGLEANTRHGIFADGNANNATNRWDNYLVTS